MLDQQVVHACRDEILDLHRFFTAWFQADVPDDDAAWMAFGYRLAPTFVLITPEGRALGREELLASLRPRYGAYEETGFPIGVRGFDVHFVGDHTVVATYEEWQRAGEHETARLSTAVFERDPSQVNNVRWLHVHETWMPGKAP